MKTPLLITLTLATSTAFAPPPWTFPLPAHISGASMTKLIKRPGYSTVTETITITNDLMIWMRATHFNSPPHPGPGVDIAATGYWLRRDPQDQNTGGRPNIFTSVLRRYIEVTNVTAGGNWLARTNTVWRDNSVWQSAPGGIIGHKIIVDPVEEADLTVQVTYALPNPSTNAAVWSFGHAIPLGGNISEFYQIDASAQPRTDAHYSPTMRGNAGYIINYGPRQPWIKSPRDESKDRFK